MSADESNRPCKKSTIWVCERKKCTRTRTSDLEIDRKERKVVRPVMMSGNANREENVARD